MIVGVATAALTAGLFVAVGPTVAAPPDDARVGAPALAPVSHELPNPLEDKRRELRKQGLTAVLNGEATPQRRGSSTVVKVGTEEAAAGSSRARARTEGSAGRVDQYVELSRETTDKIFVVLAEFGNERDPNYPDQDTDPTTPGPSRFDGPLHNEIPEPNRAIDNSTVWQADYDRQHYEDLYFATDPGVESVATYYDRQSSGRYTVEGTVTDWVKVRFNEARYGRSNGYPCADIVCNNTWNLVQDSIDQWTADQIASGKTAEQVAAELAEFDVWDRYDYDGDGNFDESDGYIDHFQIVHSGGDQADGDPYQGEDAIWSHRWYAFGTDVGSTGPGFNRLGGAEVGDTNLWVGDYTIQPENGGISVFVHEYGHDLGLPDHYDLAGGENGVNWWTLMAQSRVDGAGDIGLGTRAADLSAWDKLQLGWFDYEIVVAGQRKRVELGPHEYNSAKAQGLVVVLPKKEVTSDLGAPAAGDFQWWSGSGDNLNNSLQRTLDFTGATTASMSLKARWDIEAEYDYLYAQASLDGGTTWISLDGTVNGQPFIRDASGAPALSGTQTDWADVVVPMDAAAGQEVEFRFLYRTDGGVAPIGFFADEIVITADGEPIVTDGAENAPNGWTADGFSAVGATQTQEFDNYYIASYRNYLSYDKYLQTGPYNFGFNPDRPDFVERFPYQDGLLISYWDTSYSDNNTSQHPGEGEILVIDANPEPRYRLDGGLWRARVAGYDAPFGLQKSDSFSLSFNGRSSYLRGQAAKPTFDDTKKYWYEEQPGAGVKVPATGTVIRVVKQEGTSMTVQVSSRR